MSPAVRIFGLVGILGLGGVDFCLFLARRGRATSDLAISHSERSATFKRRGSSR